MDILDIDWREKSYDGSAVCAYLGLANEVQEILDGSYVEELLELALNSAEAGDIPEPGILEMLRQSVGEFGRSSNDKGDPFKDHAVVRICVAPFMGVGLDMMELVSGPEEALKRIAEIAREDLDNSDVYSTIPDEIIQRLEADNPGEGVIPAEWLNELVEASKKMIAEVRAQSAGDLYTFQKLFEPFFEHSESSVTVYSVGEAFSILADSVEISCSLPPDLKLPRDEAVFLSLLEIWNKPYV